MKVVTAALQHAFLVINDSYVIMPIVNLHVFQITSHHLFVNRLIMDLNKLPLTLLPIAGERAFMR